MKDNILYLETRGGADDFGTDLNNYRYTTVENIDLIFSGVHYNVFFEFGHWTRYHYRTTNKRTGAPLKKAVKELVNINGLNIDTEYEKEETNSAGITFKIGHRLSELEQVEIYDKNRNYNRGEILDLINKYSVKHFDKVVIIDEKAKEIIEKKGGFREKDILSRDPYFEPEMWTNEHKIIEVRARQGEKNGCYIDLVTEKITG